MAEEPRRFVLRATPLPWGDEPEELWILGERFVEGPLAGAEELAPPGGYVLPGLVDAHSHISYPQPLDAPAHTEAFMNAHRRSYRAAGVLALRDMGAASDHVLSLPERLDLPKVRAAGRLLLRHREPPMIPTEPDQLVDVALAQVRAGAPWVKVFADFSDDFEGASDIGFTGADPLTYPPQVLEDLCRAVHAEGARVAAHSFTVAGAEASVHAGVDSIEHGWGLEPSTVALLAERGGAWCPLLGIAPEIRRVATRKADRERLAWLEETEEKLAELIPRAREAGVVVLAGTDRGPGMHVAEEVLALVRFGLSSGEAIDAAGPAARRYLGLPVLTPGTPADLTLYREDPRVDPRHLFHPERILLGGRRQDEG